MPSKTLTFDIFGRDRSASKTINTVASNAQKMGTGLAKVGKVLAVGLAAAGAATVAFGIDSVKAYAEAQKSQAKLADAFTRFPSLADTNIKTLQKLNTQLAQKTRFDDDATASGQAVLAQFGLTGAQLQKLTPLLQDYAAKTGKDLPTAAGDLGKALLGQGRALKAIGIDFTDTGDLAGNFDQLVGGLRTQVGGFAEKEGNTAAGKLEILKNRFGEIQETVGGPLTGALTDLATWFSDEGGMKALEEGAAWIAGDGVQAFKDAWTWADKYKGVLGPAAIAIGVLTVAQWGLNIAMNANPIGLVVLGLGALVLAGTAVATNFGGVTDHIMRFGSTILGFAAGVGLAVAGMFEGLVNGVIGSINTILGPVNMILGALGMPKLQVGKVNFTSGLAGLKAGAENLAAQKSPFATMNASGPLTRKTTATLRPGLGGLAEGGVVPATPGGGWFNVGEGRWDEAVVPLSPQILEQLGGGGSSSGQPLEINVIVQSKGGVDLTKYIDVRIEQRDNASSLTSRMGKQVR